MACLVIQSFPFPSKTGSNSVPSILNIEQGILNLVGWGSPTCPLGPL